MALLGLISIAITTVALAGPKEQKRLFILSEPFKVTKIIALNHIAGLSSFLQLGSQGLNFTWKLKLVLNRIGFSGYINSLQKCEVALLIWSTNLLQNDFKCTCYDTWSLLQVLDQAKIIRTITSRIKNFKGRSDSVGQKWAWLAVVSKRAENCEKRWISSLLLQRIVRERFDR